MSPALPLLVEIPGVPVAQGRGRAVRCGASIRVIDPERSRSWKGAAQVWMLKARQAAGIYAPLDGPLSVFITAAWPRPKSAKGDESYLRPSRPDADNVAKAVFDAGNGVLWADDAQIVRVTVEKWVCHREGYPHVSVKVVEAGTAIALVRAALSPPSKGDAT